MVREGRAMEARRLDPLRAVAAALMLLIAVAGSAAYAPNAGAQTTASTAQNPDPWPRQVHIDGAAMTVYQPQVDSWDGGFLQLRAAVALKPDGSKSEVFGIIRASAHTLVDRSSR